MILLETSSARDGTGNGRPAKLASSASKRRPISGNTDRSPYGLRQDPPVLLSISPKLVQPFNLYMNSIMLRTNSLTLKGLTLSDEVNDIHYIFCLAEDENLINESVILRYRYKALSHLAYAEEWLDKRSTGFRTLYYIYESSPERELTTIRNSSPNDPGQHQPRQQSSVENSPRRSARLGAHLVRGSSTSTPPRRSARLVSTRR
ncbi:hypothetical protein N7475_007218 [Penicillium sp. IBT 31633x]|nr:hypothetical protein N7475_007218 [Penicillium sp. IBT 31633x]